MENKIKEVIIEAADFLTENYYAQGLFERQIGERIPKRDEIISIVKELRRVMFPGYFGMENIAYVSFDRFVGNTLALIYEKLFKQVKAALSYGHHGSTEKAAVQDKAQELVLAFFKKLPEIQGLLVKDVEAGFWGDPAANSREEIIISYPGLFAIYVYRIAHELYELNIPFIPRIMSEYAHNLTGIDINPGAKIGEFFFIDHGTGIVIGETTTIGNHVKIYQGVTLGALSTRKGQELSGVKRHPTIEDHVVIYSNTTILGGGTVIGANSVVAGNCFITESIPADTKVAAVMPELNYKKKTR